MPITLSKIANNSANITFQYGEDIVTLEYYPGHITEKIFAQLQSFGDMNENNMIAGFASFNEILCQLIKCWDVYEDDEQTTMFPIVPDRFAELPFAFRLAVLGAIAGDIGPETIAPQMKTQKS